MSPGPWIRDCRDAAALGGHPVRRAADAVAMPVYVRRDVTPEVAMSLRKPARAVIEGLAGFGTRVAFEAMRGLRSSRRLIVPQSGPEMRKPGSSTIACRPR